MAAILYFAFVLVFSLFVGKDACPMNCYCDNERSECILKSCKDPISKEYTDLLILRGIVCVEQRERLSNIVYSNTILFLTDDECGDLRNCRLVILYKNIKLSTD
jgi:hypothetical protein